MKPLPLALLIAAAALAPAASAAAAPHWSSPTPAIPSGAHDGLNAAAPEAFVTPGGRTLALSGDGTRGLLAAGDVKNRFGTPVPVGAGGAQSAFGVRGALGPDGELAVLWTAHGRAHVSVVPDGGDPGAPADLPGAGVNAMDVGVAGDGTVIAAYRTKDGPSQYALRVATAPAGGSFGEPAVVDSGGPIDAINLATGAGNAVAVAYRKHLNGRYRARVAVKAPGAEAFEPGQTVSSLNDSDDVQPHVAFNADGTIVAAWASLGGARYALRPAGASAFGASTGLGPGASTDVDLTVTPEGGSAVALSGDGRVQVAGQPNGGAFGPVTSIGSFGTPIAADAAVTADAAGTVTVVYGDPTDGKVHATDVGGADSVIGYGRKGAPTAVDVAASADRTVALWSAEGGSIDAATRSEQAPPSTGIGSAPSGRDTKGPKITGPSATLRRITVSKATRRIAFTVRVDEPAMLLVTADLRTTPGRTTVVSPLRTFRTSKLRSGPQTVTLGLGTAARRALRKALAKKRGGRVFVRVAAYDADGNASTQRLQLTLKPPVSRGR